jgi:hypothetical protein
MYNQINNFSTPALVFEFLFTSYRNYDNSKIIFSVASMELLTNSADFTGSPGCNQERVSESR